jgi:hypothetical protein
MSLSVREVIDVIKDRLTRENISADTRPLPAFVRKYLGVACNTAIANYLKDPRRRALDLPGQLYRAHEVAVGYDETRRRHYIDLPSGVPILDGDHAIQILGRGNDEFEVSVLRPGDPSRNEDLAFYGTPFARIEHRRAWLLHFDATVEHLVVNMVTFAGDLALDDLLPVPAEVEGAVLDIVVAWFTGKLQMPPDVLVDNETTT